MTLRLLLSMAVTAVGAFPLPGLDAFPDAAYDAVAPYRAVLVGEYHGTNEAPRLALALARLLAKRRHEVILALEIPASEQAAIDAVRETGSLKPLGKSRFFRRERQDGRSSQAMAAMILASRGVPKLRVVGIDVDGLPPSQKRDTAMAGKLAWVAASHPRAKLVALIHQVHARRTIGAPWDPTFRPLAFELTHRSGLKPADVLSVKIETEHGPTLQGGPVTAANVGRFERELSPMTGYDATLYWPDLTASPPFKGR